MFTFEGSWTNTVMLASDVGGHDKFSKSGVAVYASTIAVGTKDTDEIAVYSDTGTKQASLSLTDVKGIAMYGSVIAAHDGDDVYTFEKLSGAWTQTASLSRSDCKNVAMYSNFIVAGAKGTLSCSFCCLQS